MNFSIYIPSFPKAAAASVLADSQPISSSFSSQQSLIPLPPPPAVAFNITGYLIFFAILFAAFKFSNNPAEPGIVGTFAFFIVSLADALSPMESICSGNAPINLISCS